MHLSSAYGLGMCKLQHGDLSVTVDEDHDMVQLRTIDVTQIKYTAHTQSAPQVYCSAFMSLLGAIAWLCLTRLDILVFVGKFQRCGGKPTVGDVFGINTLLRWIKRN